MFENNYDHIQHAELSERLASGANWFYWIAGLTLVTSIIQLMGGSLGFGLSLGITRLIDGFAVYFADSFGDATKVVAIVLDIFITAMFAAFGYLSNKRYQWAYLTGMIVFLFDSLLSLLILSIIGIIVHCIALFFLIRGYIAGRDLLRLERDLAESAQAAESSMSPAPAAQPTY